MRWRFGAERNDSVVASLRSGQLQLDLMLLIALVTGVGLCLLVYAPWSQEPLDILDFSEFLLAVKAGEPLWANWSRLSHYYASQGRVTEVAYGVIAASYHVFHLDPLGWQAVRAIQMLALPPVVYLLLRRYGASSFGAVLGASLFLVGTVPAASWLRQTAEPVATLFFLGAAGLACGFSEERTSWRQGIAVGLCLVGLLFSKETLVASLPFLLLAASCWQANGRVRAFRWDRRTAWFAGACAIAVALLAIALMWARSMLRPQAYVSLYGTATTTSNLSAGRVFPFLLPVIIETRRFFEPILFPANLVFVGMLGVAGLMAWRRTPSRELARKLLIASTLPIGGLLVYLPWPRFQVFYALPFLVGTSLGVAILFGELGRSPRWKAVIVPCWIVMLGASALVAFGQARYTRARREVNYAVASDLARFDAADTVMVMNRGNTPQTWQNPAATLGRYALATGVAVSRPVLLDVDCDSTSTVFGEHHRRATLYVYVGRCGDIGKPDRRIQRTFSYFEWGSQRLKSATVAVDVFERPRE